MSGSPKYSTARVTPTVASDFAYIVAQFRAAAAERSRRQAEKERQQQVTAAKTVLLNDIRSLSAEIEHHRESSYARWAPGLAALPNFDALASTVAGATDLSVLESVRYQHNRAAADVHRIVSAAQGAQQAEVARQQMERRQAEALAALASLETTVAAIDQTLATKFDASGAQQLLSLVVRTKEFIRQNRFDKAISCAKETTVLAARHGHHVLQAQHEWLQKRQAARAALHESEALLRAALSDRVITAWRKDAVEALGAKLSDSAQCIEREAWDEAATVVKDVRVALDEATREATQREVEEAQRRYIAKSVISVLHEQGFYTDPPRLLTDDPNSDVVIQAVRSDERCLQIGIQRHGRVRYEVDGSSRVLTASPTGAMRGECPEAESTIMALHKQLGTDFGINMDELTWEGKPLDDSQAGIVDKAGNSTNECREVAV